MVWKSFTLIRDTCTYCDIGDNFSLKVVPLLKPRTQIQYITPCVVNISLNISIFFRFDFLPYTVNLNYQASLLRTHQEIGIVLLGPGSNIIVFVLLICVSWLCQKIIGGFPDVGSKFVLSYGLHTFLDPFLILAVDCILLVRS